MSKLSRIEIICDMSKFASLKSLLSKLEVGGMTFIQVLGCGAEKGTKEYEGITRFYSCSISSIIGNLRRNIYMFM